MPVFRNLLLGSLLLLSSGRADAQEGTNQRDAKGRPHGTWLVTHPARMSDPPYTEYGTYDHGRKTGLWRTVNSEGMLLSTEQFRNNTLDGESRYYEGGTLVTLGHYRGLNPDQALDTIWVKDPVTHAEKQVVIPTERGSLRHGTWQYFNPETGRLLLEEEYQVDDLISHRRPGLSKADSVAYQRYVTQLPHNKTPTPAKVQPGRLTER